MIERPAAVEPSRPVRERRSVGDRALRAVTGVVGGVGAVGRSLARTWRRSLQLRVGTTTVVVTGIVVLVVGLFLVDKVSGGVLKAKRDAAVNQAKIGLPQAQQVLADIDAGSFVDVTQAQSDLTSDLTANGNNAGLFSIKIVPVSDSVAQQVAKPVIPAGLRSSVQAGNLAVQYAPVPQRSTSSRLVAGLIVGEPVKARTGLFELYYLFPLTAEAQTISLIQRTVLAAALALVILVLAIALLVTRQVVRPVRVVAETAGRLAAGELSKRIAVSGTDDLARLGEAFNDMAASLQRQIRRLEDLSRLQRRFTSDVSHELRTPLTTVRMASEFLYAERDKFAPELARSAELMHDELDRFESLLGDLLEISRYDAGVANLESEPADIRGVVASTVAANSVLAQRHGSEVIVVQPDAPVTVDMDSRRVERILRNLLGNALDHGRENPS